MRNALQILSLLCLLGTGVLRPTGVKSRCEAPEVSFGHDASITCHFSENIYQKRTSFTIYRYTKSRNTKIKSKEPILDCFWTTAGNYTCSTPENRYKFDMNVSRQVTVIIEKASDADEGRYECSTEPSGPRDNEGCSLKLIYPKGVSSRCVAESVNIGETASVLCEFSEDINKTSSPFAVYWKNETSKVAIADCAWLKKDTLMCGKMADGYEFNHTVNSQLTVTIKEASSAFVGTYECIPQPSYPGDTESCFFSLKEKPMPPTTAPPAGSPSGHDGTTVKDDEGESCDNTAVIVVVVVLLVLLLVAGILLLKYRSRERKHIACLRSETDKSRTRDVDETGSTSGNPNESVLPLLPTLENEGQTPTTSAPEDVVRMESERNKSKETTDDNEHSTVQGKPRAAVFVPLPPRHKKKTDDHLPNKNLLFYQNKIESRPDGAFIDDIHQEWGNNHDLIEKHHTYIQWLFPTREAPEKNRHAQRLHSYEVKAIMQGETTSQRFIKSYAMMLNCFCFKLVNHKTGEIACTDNAVERFRHLLDPGHKHNFLRITRILTCLGEMGLERYKAPLVQNLIYQARETGGNLAEVEKSCKEYWIPTVADDKKKEELWKLAEEAFGD